MSTTPDVRRSACAPSAATARLHRRARTAPGRVAALALAACLAAPAAAQVYVGGFPSSGTVSASHGRAVAIDGTRMAVAAPLTINARVKTYSSASGTWVATQTLTPPPGEEAGFFGDALALDGDVLVIGQSGNDVAASDAGAVYVYRDVGGTWTLEQTLRPVELEVSSLFGASVAIDDDVILVGAPGHDALAFNSGAAWVYRDDGTGTWLVEDVLTVPTDPFLAAYGHAVAIQDDLAIVTSVSEDALSVFDRSGGSWALATTFGIDPSMSFGEVFGAAVALDDDLLVVGSSPKRVFVYRGGGASWTEEAMFEAPGSFLQYGTTVDVQGDLVLVGDPEATGSTTNGGLVHAHVLTGPGTWSPPFLVTEPNNAENDRFGASVAVSGTTLLVGANNDGSDGVAHVFDVDYFTPVSVTSVTPASGGLGGFNMVTLGGDGLSDVAEVLVDGVEAPAFTRLSDEALKFTVPPGALLGAADVTLTDASGVATLPGAYTYVPTGPFSVSSITPANGALDGGTELTIAGGNLAGMTSVTFDGVPAAELEVLAVNELRVVTPPGFATVDVVLTNDSNMKTITDGYLFNVDEYGELPPTAPQFTAAGDTTPGSAEGFTLALDAAFPLQPIYLFVGASAASLPFLGSTALTDPVIPPLFIGNVGFDGKFAITTSIPPTTPPVSLFLQTWSGNPLAPQGFSGSNGVQLVVP